MIAKARARFSRGVLRLLEPLDLAEGQEVLVSIEEVPPPGSGKGAGLTEPATAQPEQARKALRATAGAQTGSSDPEELKRDIYAGWLANSRPETRPQPDELLVDSDWAIDHLHCVQRVVSRLNELAGEGPGRAGIERHIPGRTLSRGLLFR